MKKFFARLLLVIIASCLPKITAAKNLEISLVNAAGYESNLNNTPASGERGFLNDTKVRAHYTAARSEHFKFGLKAGLNSAYRQSGRPLNAQVWQLMPRINANTVWTPGILTNWKFKAMFDLNYSHKFNPYFKNNPADDATNIINISEDDGFQELESETNHDSRSDADHQNDIGATESANTDADDDFEDPTYVGTGSGQSYAALKSFARSTYVNNYSGRISLLARPWPKGEARLSANGAYNNVGDQAGLLPASSAAHAYELSLQHEVLGILNFQFLTR